MRPYNKSTVHPEKCRQASKHGKKWEYEDCTPDDRGAAREEAKRIVRSDKEES